MMLGNKTQNKMFTTTLRRNVDMVSRSVFKPNLNRNNLSEITKNGNSLINKRLLSDTVKGAEPVERYALSLRWLHWLQAGSVIGAIGAVTFAQSTPKTPEGQKQKMDAMFYHKSFGTFIFFTIPLRVLIAVTTKRPAPLPSPLITQVAAAGTHLALYGGLLFLSTTGISMAYVSGKPIPFFFTTIAASTTPDQESAKLYYSWHKRVAYWWKFIIPLHIAGAGFHFVRGQRIFARMNPFVG
jgi:cytochrome b561